jgi:hypothetical protein
MPDPPGADHHRQNQQSQNLITPEDAPLRFAPFLLGDLLLVRLDEASSHSLDSPAFPAAPGYDPSIGGVSS